MHRKRITKLNPYQNRASANAPSGINSSFEAGSRVLLLCCYIPPPPRKRLHTPFFPPAEQFASYVSVRGTVPKASAAGALLLERLKVGGFIESFLRRLSLGVFFFASRRLNEEVHAEAASSFPIYIPGCFYFERSWPIYGRHEAFIVESRECQRKTDRGTYSHLEASCPKKLVL